MSELTIDQSTLSSDCVKNLQRYLNTEQIVTQQVDNTSQGQVLGVLCKINSIGVNPDSSLVIIAAQPLENTSWNFGTCFPSLPGAEEESSLQRLLRMRFLTLQKALWLFIWGQDIQTGVVKEQIATTDWFQAWAKEQGITDTSPENLRTFFDSLNFTENELQSEPKASWRRLAGINQNTETGEDPNNPVSGLFFWGDVWQTSAT
ncbi:MAG TPA: hypothetical protein DCF68_16965, partial [Cyanothece sp. UBA12306]|nr:hypothetical protein [Cyanothece sp. UBA12306]